jgi:hypothetical protein
MTAAAAMVGVTPAQLQEHVTYWTLRNFSGGGVNDLDGELRRSIGSIRERGETARAKALRAKAAPPRAFGAQPLPAFEANSKALAYAKRHGLDVAGMVKALIEDGVPDKLGLGRAQEILEGKLRQAARAARGAA